MPDAARPDDPSTEHEASSPDGRPELVAVPDESDGPAGARPAADAAPTVGPPVEAMARPAAGRRSERVSRAERRERRDALARAAREQARDASRSLSDLSARVASSRRGMARQTADENRLRAELGLFARDLEAVTQRGHHEGTPWAVAANSLLADAANAFSLGESAESWKLLRAARRQAYEGRTREELAVEAELIAADARRELPEVAANRIVKDLGSLKASERLEKIRVRMASAREQVDQVISDRDDRYRVAARGLVHVGVLLALLIVGGAVAAWFSTSLADEGEVLRNLDNYCTIAALGGMGVAISLLLPWRRTMRRSAVAEFLNPVDITLLRVVLGVGAALVVVIILQSDLQAGLDVAGVKAYPWAIAAGFTERLLDRRLLAADEDARREI